MYFFHPFIICKSLKFQTVLQGEECERDPGGNKELLEESQIYQSRHLQSAMKDIPARHVAAAMEQEHQFTTARERSCATPLFNILVI